MQTLYNYLAEKSYPGRGIFVGKAADTTVSAYFIMGRSENSQNRIFCMDGTTLRTEAFDPAKVADPSLIIYNCSRVFNNTDIITNGDHTDTVYDFLQDGSTFEQGMHSRRYEPDGPNYTPRIAAVINADCVSYGICRGDESGDDPGDVRMFFCCPKKDGVGRIIHTYRGETDGVLQPYVGEPSELILDYTNIDTFTEKLWESLDNDNRVSLFVRYRNDTTGTEETRIVNRNR